MTNRRVMAVLAYLEASGPSQIRPNPMSRRACTGRGPVAWWWSSVSSCFVLGVYVVVVLGGGALIGRTDSPSPVLSVLATAVVALAFAPVQAWLERAVGRIGQRPATPYDVLRGSPRRVSSGDVTDGAPGPHVAAARRRAPARSGRRSGSSCPTA